MLGSNHNKKWRILDALIAASLGVQLGADNCE